MKNCYKLIFTILITFLAQNLNSQSFRQVTDYTYPNISDAYFLSSTTGWFVASAGEVRKTTDGGVTWDKLSTNITDNLTNVFFLDNNTGFAGGAGDKIFKTTDGGTTWDAINVTGGTGSLYGIYFSDVNKGWLLASTSSAAQIIRTTDGGVSWNIDLNHTAGDLEDMDFFGPTNGIVVGGGLGKMDLFFTTNGTTWTKAPVPALPTGYTRLDVRGINMIDANTAYAVGWGSSVGLQPSIHLKTTDGGATWTYLTQVEENRTYDNLWAVYFKDVNNGIAVGGATRGSVALRTTDAGQNWIPIDIPCGVQLNAINGFGDELIVSGSSGVIFRSSDFGDSWQLLTPIPTGNLNSITTLTDDLIFAGGFNSVFLKTTNGNDWQGGFLRADGAAPNIQGMFFVNENVGYSAHSYGMASKTTDGGNTWKQVIPVTLSATSSLYALHFFDENSGFIVGKESNSVDIIYQTTDGGQTWDKKTNLFAANLRGIAFRDVSNGIVVGEKLKAAYTTDGGNTWNPSAFNSLPPGTTTPNLLKVIYSSGSNAVAVGEQLILLSSDGGASWNYSPVNDLVEAINGVSFIDPNSGWAVGSKTSAVRSVGLYFTSDAGGSWVNQVDLAVFDTMRALYDVSISPSGYAWISGGSSAIYTNSPLVGITDVYLAPISYSLHQNYPNPFNPSTKIRWQSPMDGWQNIKIYDILGREVATLVDEYKPSGSYEVDFDASRLTSGVYFYQLKSRNYFAVKKMILLK